MTGDFAADFLQIATRHAGEAVYVKKLTSGSIKSSNGLDAHVLALALAKEKASRAMVIAWKPNSIAEAEAKLLYIVQYLVVMRTSLDDKEMDAIMNSISHLDKHHRVSPLSVRLPDEISSTS